MTMRLNGRKILAQAAGLAIVAAGLTLGTASVASAAGTCSGSLVGTYHLKQTDGTIVSTARVYYSSANGGTNCVTNTAVLYYGKLTQLNVWVGRHDGTGVVGDLDDYRYYAGPVSVTRTDGKCIDFGVGAADGPNATMKYIWQRVWTNVHCG
ncbi:hypothetical protein ACFY9C_36095 [Streptomyces filamentosus]|uniref:hypothetical protein n=1 Tax=Streptomyces filamentosus TaxID=67294 RepID=UPI0036F07B2A